MPEIGADRKIICFHCGDICPDHSIGIDEKYFCCSGCRLVYEIITENNLDGYYTLETAPGISPEKIKRPDDFRFLENDRIIKRLADFVGPDLVKVTFHIPQMHCASCVWLLENLEKLIPGIIGSRVNFTSKKLSISFSPGKTDLRTVVEFLSRIGYRPELSLDSLSARPEKVSKKDLHKKIAVAGFCFFNIMILSLPEYFPNIIELQFRSFFGILKMLLALPVLLYSSTGYFKSAFLGIRQRMVNMDVPISLGITILFTRSAFEIISGGGIGYMDSFTGLVFFLLVGRLFQEKTYGAISFDRDYRSYFPMAVKIKHEDDEKTVLADEIDIGDTIIARNGELIPADGVLLGEVAFIDYSFVTGESDPVTVNPGDTIYAGGKVAGKAVEVEVTKPVSGSYLTELWNNEVFTQKTDGSLITLSNTIGKYFTAAVIAIAAGAAVFWYNIDPNIALNAATAVLIIACPCALALSTPFTLGTAIRIFGKNGLYLKNSSVVEKLGKIGTVIFDKTGTITESGKAEVKYYGNELTMYEINLVKTLSGQSTHPLSRSIYGSLEKNESYNIISFREEPGKGIEGIVDGNRVKIGSRQWVYGNAVQDKSNSGDTRSRIFISINNYPKGYFSVSNVFRRGLKTLLKSLMKRYRLILLSGDNERELMNVRKMFGDKARLLFNRSPHDKLAFVKDLQRKGEKVLMMGDGLNDAGSLKQSDIGISLSEDVGSFSPACDGILDSGRFSDFGRFLSVSRSSLRIIIASFIISFLYNVIGLSFAVAGKLSPLVSAILMPLSSISVVLFTTSVTKLIAARSGLK
jgi:Cu+-exporting ATPase